MRNLDIAYYLELQRRLEEVFLYVACDEQNFNTYSIKIENLFVDVCTFFDSLCQTTILEHSDQGFTFSKQAEVSKFLKKISSQEYFNMGDYCKLLLPDLIRSDYKLTLVIHEDDLPGSHIGPRIKDGYTIEPFKNWSTTILDWWNAFTRLKHNRLANFEEATLGRTIYSLGATYIILSVKNQNFFKAGHIDGDLYRIFLPTYWQRRGGSMKTIPTWK